ncbi:YhcN/YlaJ family sporulation lipoprotein [Solibacillus sp. CAU 1738]|uniref:YhcN/YlaJ family sporulation lipoprotein n=1 Tax=Solibacillus sp. CAU 1738 TaxID=3140363 RepID=UPI003261871D
MKYFLSIVGCVLLLSACASAEKIVMYDEQSDKAREIKQQLEKTKEVEKANVVEIDDEILVAVQTKPLNSFKERKTAKKLQDKLEEKWPNYDILVSSDFKLYWETSKLIAEKDRQRVSEKVKELKKLAKEES